MDMVSQGRRRTTSSNSRSSGYSSQPSIRLLRNRQGQLFLMEVLIAISVLIIMVAALNNVSTNSERRGPSDLKETATSVLSSLGDGGILSEYVSVVQTGSPTELNASRSDLASSIYGMLTGNSEFVLKVFEYSGGGVWTEVVGGTLNPTISAPTGVETVVVEYMVAGYGNVLHGHSLQLTVWYEGLS